MDAGTEGGCQQEIIRRVKKGEAEKKTWEVRIAKKRVEEEEESWKEKKQNLSEQETA